MDTEIKATAKAEGQPVERPVYKGRDHALFLTQKAKDYLAENESNAAEELFDNLTDALGAELGKQGFIGVFTHNAQKLARVAVEIMRRHLKRESGWQPKPPTSAINALIGYLSALKPGEVVTHEYITRLNEHYIPALEKRGNE